MAARKKFHQKDLSCTIKELFFYITKKEHKMRRLQSVKSLFLSLLFAPALAIAANSDIHTLNCMNLADTAWGATTVIRPIWDPNSTFAIPFTAALRIMQVVHLRGDSYQLVGYFQNQNIIDGSCYQSGGVITLISVYINYGSTNFTAVNPDYEVNPNQLLVMQYALQTFLDINGKNTYMSNYQPFQLLRFY
jgi:hypothetical protein